MDWAPIGSRIVCIERGERSNDAILQLAAARIGADHPAFAIAAEVWASITTANWRRRSKVRSKYSMESAGADAVTSDSFKADEFVGDPAQLFTYRSRGQDVTEPRIDMFRRCELPNGAWREIAPRSAPLAG